MAANYDNAAWFYDRLSRLVYGETLINAQTHFLSYIPVNANILIAGGGTGEILEAVSTFHPSGLTIYYVEISSKMLAKARQRNAGGNQIIFINKPVEEADIPQQIDVVITPFLLDSLSPGILDKVFNRLDELLVPGGLWLNTDFQLTGKWWQKPLLKSMYWFFRILGCVQNTDLPDMPAHFEQAGYRMHNGQTFFRGFISASVYRKQGN